LTTRSHPSALSMVRAQRFGEGHDPLPDVKACGFRNRSTFVDQNCGLRPSEDSNCVRGFRRPVRFSPIFAADEVGETGSSPGRAATMAWVGVTNWRRSTMPVLPVSRSIRVPQHR
jgi:hypothetical protein